MSNWKRAGRLLAGGESRFYGFVISAAFNIYRSPFTVLPSCKMTMKQRWPYAAVMKASCSRKILQDRRGTTIIIPILKNSCICQNLSVMKTPLFTSTDHSGWLIAVWMTCGKIVVIMDFGFVTALSRFYRNLSGIWRRCTGHFWPSAHHLL